MGAFPYRTAAVLVVVLGLAGCGSSPATKPSTAASTPAASTAASSPATAGTAVTATETEFSITLSQQTFTPGRYTFTAVDKGHFAHDLVIEGPGVDKATSSTLSPGGSTTLSVTLQTGSYELWCSIDSHKDRGMDLKITVS